MDVAQIAYDVRHALRRFTRIPTFVLGLVAALGVTRLIARLLYGVQAWDPATFVVVPMLVIVVAFLAVWLPARRASRVDPIVALRDE